MAMLAVRHANSVLFTVRRANSDETSSAPSKQRQIKQCAGRTGGHALPTGELTAADPASGRRHVGSTGFFSLWLC